jgi:hypothetical protein
MVILVMTENMKISGEIFDPSWSFINLTSRCKDDNAIYKMNHHLICMRVITSG